MRDWENVARHIAADMVQARLLPDPQTRSAAPLRSVPFYVEVATPRSQFLYEVKRSLEAEIVQRGGTVVLSPQGAAKISLDVDVVQWAPRNRMPDGTLTAAGLASGGAVVLGNQAPLTPAAGFGILAGAGLLADLVRTMTPDTDTEVAWGASIAEGNRVIFAARYPMYIADADWPHYAAPPQLAGPPPLFGPPAVQLRYAP